MLCIISYTVLFLIVINVYIGASRSLTGLATQYLKPLAHVLISNTIHYILTPHPLAHEISYAVTKAPRPHDWLHSNFMKAPRRSLTGLATQ